MGKVLKIGIAESKGNQIEDLNEVDVVSGKGLVKDRHFRKNNHKKTNNETKNNKHEHKININKLNMEINNIKHFTLEFYKKILKNVKFT